MLQATCQSAMHVCPQEKQVAQLRERSKLSGYPVLTGEDRDGVDTAQQGALQDSHAAELRNGADASPGDAQATSSQREGDHDPAGIHHYSQQRPAEVPCCVQLPDAVPCRAPVHVSLPQHMLSKSLPGSMCGCFIWHVPSSAPPAPMQLEAPPVDDEDYRKQRALSDIREPYRSASLLPPHPRHDLCWLCYARACTCIKHSTAGHPSMITLRCGPIHRVHPAMRRIPHEYLRGTKQFLGSALPDSPLLVFINSRSGGRAGTRLAEVLCHAIGHSQVPKCTSPSRPLHSMLVARRSQRAHRPAGGLRHALSCCELQVPGIGTCALCGQRIAIMSS